mgnify:CR=1 FL=1
MSVPPTVCCEPRIQARPSREESRIAAFFLTDCADEIDDSRPGQESKTEHWDAGRKCDATGDRGELWDLLKQGGGEGHGTSEIRAMEICAWEAG